MRTDGSESASLSVSLESIWHVNQTTHTHTHTAIRLLKTALTADLLAAYSNMFPIWHPDKRQIQPTACWQWHWCLSVLMGEKRQWSALSSSSAPFVEMNASSHRFNEFNSDYPAGKWFRGWLASCDSTVLCKFFLSSFSFISSYAAYITVLQLTQLRGNRRAEEQRETGLGVCLSVKRMRLQRTLNSSNMVKVGHRKQKPSLMVCGLRSFCHSLASCSVCVKASDSCLALSVTA